MEQRTTMKPVVFLDIDETLIYSRHRLEGSTPFVYEGVRRFTLLRPSAQEFVQELQKHYSLYAMTQGVIHFQRKATEAVGLLPYLNDIFGHSNVMSGFPPYLPEQLPEKWVLVDNCATDDWILHDKRLWLKTGGAFLPHEHVKCVPFEGHEGAADSLMQLLPEIQEKLG